MYFNIDFKPEIMGAILMNKPLCMWFKRNQDLLKQYGIIHDKCLHFEDKDLDNRDIRSLGRIASVCFTCLEGDFPLDAHDRVNYAVACMMEVYELEKDNLSDSNKTRFMINPPSKKILIKKKTGN